MVAAEERLRRIASRSRETKSILILILIRLST